MQQKLAAITAQTACVKTSAHKLTFMACETVRVLLFSDIEGV